MSAQLARRSPGLVLPDELPVHGNEEFLAVLSEAGIPADGLDHVQGGLVVAAGDRKIAEQSGQGARLQFQGTLEVGNFRGSERPTSHCDTAALLTPAALPSWRCDSRRLVRVSTSMRRNSSFCAAVGKAAPSRVERSPEVWPTCSSSLFVALDRLPIMVVRSPTALYHHSQ